MNILNMLPISFFIERKKQNNKIIEVEKMNIFVAHLWFINILILLLLISTQFKVPENWKLQTYIDKYIWIEFLDTMYMYKIEY